MDGIPEHMLYTRGEVKKLQNFQQEIEEKSLEQSVITSPPYQPVINIPTISQPQIIDNITSQAPPFESFVSPFFIQKIEQPKVEDV